MYLLVGKRTGKVYHTGRYRADCLRWLHGEYPDDGEFKGKVLPEPMVIKKSTLWQQGAHKYKHIISLTRKGDI